MLYDWTSCVNEACMDMRGVHACKIVNRIRKAMNHAHAERIKEPPDIVIHSFGSHLFTILLGMKEFSDLKFGRVISVGSVLYDQILNGVYSSLLVASRLF